VYIKRKPKAEISEEILKNKIVLPPATGTEER
jgi:hypothetical protein